MITSSAPDSAQRFENLARLAQTVSVSLDLQEVLDAVARTALDLLPDACACIWVAEDERVVLRAEAGALGRRDVSETREFAFGEGLTGEIALTREVMVLEDIRDDPNAVNVAWIRQERFISYIGIPLHAKDKLVGVLSLATRHYHPFSLHEVEVLGSFADQAAIAIDNARLYENAAARVRRLQALTRLNQLISSSLDSEEVLREIACAAGKLMEAPVASFWRVDESQRIARLVAYSDPAMEDFPARTMTWEQGFLGWTANHRETVNVPDVFADDRCLAPQWWRAHELRSFLGIPVILDGTLLAVLALNARRPFRLEEDDRDLVDSFVAQAAVAIRNAQLFASSEHRRQTAEALEEIGRSLAQSLDPEEVGRRIVESLSRLVGAKAVRLYVVEEATEDSVLLASTGAVPWNRRAGPGVGAVGLAIHERHLITSRNVLTDERITLTPEIREQVVQSQLVAVVAIPLLVKDRAIGTLAIADEEGRTFTDEDIRLVQAFADQAALALDNAQLLHESRTRQARLQALLDVNRQLSGIQSLESLLTSIAESCGRLLNSDYVGFRLAEGDELVVASVAGEARQIMLKPRIKFGESLSGVVATTGAPLVVRDVARETRLLPEHREAMLRRGYRGWLGVPIKLGDRVAGVLSMPTFSEAGFSETDVAVATAFADQAAIALENVRLFHEAQQRLHQTETLLDVGQAVSSTLDLTEVMRRVARATARVLGADMVGAYLADEERINLHPIAGYHVPEHLRSAFLKHPIPLRGHSLLEDAWERLAPVSSNDVESDPRFDRQTAKLFPHRSLVFVPMVVKGEAIGGLFAIWWTVHRDIVPEEMRLVEGISKQGALSVENAELYAEATRRRRGAEELARLAQVLTESLDVQAVGQRLVDSVLSLFHVAFSRLRLLQPDGTLRSEACNPATPGYVALGLPLPTGAGVAGRAVAEGRPAWSPDVANDPSISLDEDARRVLAKSGVGAILSVPLRVKGQIIGSLSLGDRVGRRFSDAEISLVQAFADQAALALQNARLYEESERRRRGAEALLAIAQALGSTVELEEIFTIVTQRAAQAIGAERCAVYLLQRGRLAPIAAQYADGHVDPVQWKTFKTQHQYRVEEVPAYAEAIRTRRPVAIKDTITSAAVPREWSEPFGIHALLVVPIFHHNRFLGLLSFDQTSAPPLGPQELDLVLTIANQTALAVENARLFEAQRAEAETSSALLKLARAVEGAPDLDGILDAVARTTPQLLGLERCGLSLFDSASGTLIPTAAAGLSDGHRPVFLSLRGTPKVPAVVEAIRSFEPVVVDDATEDTWIPRGIADALDIRSILIIPLVSGGELMGLMAADTPGQLRAFSDKQITLARGIAGHAAGAIDRAQLHVESERRRREAEAFAELARTINASLDLDTVLQHIGEWARELCRSDAAIIALREPGSSSMVFRYWFGRAPTDLSRPIEPGQGAGGLVIATGRPFRTRNYAEDPRITKDDLGSIQVAGTVAELVVPIHIGNRVEGLLYVDNRSPRPFTERDEAILLRLAEHAAIAIRNSQLFTSEQTARSDAEALGQRYRGLVEGSIQGMYVHADFDIKFATPGFARTFGYEDPQELIGRDLRTLIAPDEIPRVEAYAAAERRGEAASSRYELRGVNRNGRLVWVENLVSRTTWDGVPAVLGTLVDITERKRAEEALHRETSFVRLLQVIAEAANQAASADEALRTALALICECTGWPVGHAYVAAPDDPEELTCAGLWRLDDPERFDPFRRLTEATRMPRGVGLPGRVLETARPAWIIDVTKDPNFPRAVAAAEVGIRAGFAFPVLVGREIVAVLEFFSSEVIEPDDKLLDVLAQIGTQLGRVVERARASQALQEGEAQIRQMQKMEAIGRLAGGVAHDFNNLLTVITGRSQLLLRRLRDPDPMRRDLTLIQKTAERATVLTRQLLAFSRKQVLQPRVVEVDAIVRGLDPMLQRLLGEDIDLVILPGSGSTRVKVDPGQLEQVVVNLAVNARDAMPRGGRLVIEINAVDVDETLARQITGLQPGSHVVLTVVDSGVGMDEETRAKIFEPFFTTKGPGKGTGLGLATVYGIVRQHQGSITVESSLGHGSTFTIYLPMTSEAPDAPMPERRAGLPTGSETVLLVEDEQEVRVLARDILQQIGYTVLEAANGLEATEICHQYSEPIQLLLTDVIMPQMSGRELAERLETVRPAMRVLFMSGYTDDALGPRALLDGERVLLQKPFTPDALARTVREVLDN